LIENNVVIGDYLRDGFRARLADHPKVGDIRGVGMLAAIEFVDQKNGRKFFDASAGVGGQVAAALAALAALAAKGVIGRAMPQGDILGFAPPFCLTKDEADIVISATEAAVRETLG
jgi:L-2,4-diaminobutyrate transaminase